MMGSLPDQMGVLTDQGRKVQLPKVAGGERCGGAHTSVAFQMPLHYPRYVKADYEAMPEWRLDCLLRQYGLPIFGDVNEKRKFAMGAFLWPSCT